jgi:hypothetical protein
MVRSRVYQGLRFLSKLTLWKKRSISPSCWPADLCFARAPRLQFIEFIELGSGLAFVCRVAGVWRLNIVLPVDA